MLVGGGGLLGVVVVVDTAVGMVGRESVVVDVETTGVDPSRVGAEMGVVAAGTFVGVLRLASKLPANSEVADAAPGFAGVVPMVGLAERDTAGVGGPAVAEVVLGWGTFVTVDGVSPLFDGNVSLWTNPT